MSYQVLARKWRPRTFQQLIGQEAVVQALVNGLESNRVHHGFVLTGTRGVGKTTIARILAKCLNCETGITSTPCGECSVCVAIDQGRFPDMQEVDAASRTGVDDMRDLLESAQYAPVQGRFKVYIIDEVHMLSKNSFNALLKTLEEPPDHVKFVLATTDPEKIPVTILSRCLRFNLRRLLPDEIIGYLDKILAEESIEAEQSAVTRLARAADGSMRDALSLMDQAIAYGGGSLRDQEVADMMGSVDHAHIARLVEALSQQDAGQILDIVRELASQARNLETVLRELADVFHRMALLQLVPEFRDPERSDWESIQALAKLVSAEDVQLFYQVAISGKRDLGMAPDPRTGLEMSLMRMLAFRPAQAESDGGGTGSPVDAKAGVNQAASKNQTKSVQATQNKNHASEDRNQQAVENRSGPRKATKTKTVSDHSGLDKRTDNTARSQAPGVDSGIEPSAKAASRSDDTAANSPAGTAREIEPEQPGLADFHVEPSDRPVSLEALQETTGNLGDAWRQLLAQLKLKGAVRELARNITLESCEQNHWRFLIPSEVRHLDSPGLVGQLQTALVSQLGQAVEIDIHTASEPVSTPAALSQQAQVRRMSEAEKAIESDPTVRALKERFDARIIEDSIQPIQ